MLIPLYSQYCNQRFRKANGDPLKRRAAQKAVRTYGLDKLIVRGHGEPLIDDVLGDEQLLRNMPVNKTAQRRRGRPRTFDT